MIKKKEIKRFPRPMSMAEERAPITTSKKKSLEDRVNELEILFLYYRRCRDCAHWEKTYYQEVGKCLVLSKKKNKTVGTNWGDGVCCEHFTLKKRI